MSLQGIGEMALKEVNSKYWYKGNEICLFILYHWMQKPLGIISNKLKLTLTEMDKLPVKIFQDSSFRGKIFSSFTKLHFFS